MNRLYSSISVSITHCLRLFLESGNFGKVHSITCFIYWKLYNFPNSVNQPKTRKFDKKTINLKKMRRLVSLQGSSFWSFFGFILKKRFFSILTTAWITKNFYILYLSIDLSFYLNSYLSINSSIRNISYWFIDLSIILTHVYLSIYPSVLFLIDLAIYYTNDISYEKK